MLYHLVIQNQDISAVDVSGTLYYALVLALAAPNVTPCDTLTFTSTLFLHSHSVVASKDPCVIKVAELSL